MIAPLSLTLPMADRSSIKGDDHFVKLLIYDREIIVYSNPPEGVE